MRTKGIVLLYCLQFFVLLIGIDFKIQHYPGGELLVLSGAVMEVLFYILFLRETSLSGSVGTILKTIWIVICSSVILVTIGQTFLQKKALLLCWLISIILGLTYLTIFRKKFAPKTREIDKIKFDSI